MNGSPTAAEFAVEIAVGLEITAGAARRLVALAAHLHQPVLVHLRRDGDGIVGMQHLVAAVVARQEAVHHRLAGDFDERLRVGEERAVATDRAGQEDALVLGHPVGDQRGVQRLLRGRSPSTASSPGRAPRARRCARPRRRRDRPARGCRPWRPSAGAGRRSPPAPRRRRASRRRCEPANTRAPTAEACLTISNCECSLSATMKSQSNSPSAIIFETYCITVSYGRIG